MWTKGQLHKEEEKDGQVVQLEVGPLPQPCSHTEPRQPLAPECLDFCSVPPKEEAFHVHSILLVV